MSELIVASTVRGVTTLRLHNPRRLNGWTAEMMDALKGSLVAACEDAATQVIVLTGTDPYYSAGVNLAGTLQLGHPRALHARIVEHNEALFGAFLAVTKPILVAVNGPSIGAAVTSATLCDAILASDKATFSTPFARLGVPPEGCSSVLFAKLMGEANAARILGEEGWAPTGTEAAAIGLADEVVEHEALLDRAQALAESWIAAGRVRSYRGGFTREELEAVNAAESVEVATAFLGSAFLKGQFDFLWSKNKRGPALMFLGLWSTRPLWSRLL